MFFSNDKSFKRSTLCTIFANSLQTKDFWEISRELVFGIIDLHNSHKMASPVFSSLSSELWENSEQP